MTWLVTGGAGYIGAHVVSTMHDAAMDVVVLDDLSAGSADRVPAGVPCVVGSVLDPDAVRSVLRSYHVEGIVHLAAKKKVDESVRNPLFYYRENLEGLRVLLEEAARADVGRLVFSSSAAVYGSPDEEYVTESTPCVPVNPYGETKLAGEWLVRDVAESTGMGYVSLRYFNVAGAAAPRLADARATNLIPIIFDRLDRGRAPVIYGADYPTPDGTPVRDYIHVQDLASAHLAAARRLTADSDTRLTLNVGRGRGVSVREVMTVVSEATGRAVHASVQGRRTGDPARVVASVDAALYELGWSSQHDVHDMVASAWEGWRAHAATAQLPVAAQRG